MVYCCKSHLSIHFHFYNINSTACRIFLYPFNIQKAAPWKTSSSVFSVFIRSIYQKNRYFPHLCCPCLWARSPLCWEDLFSGNTWNFPCSVHNRIYFFLQEKWVENKKSFIIHSSCIFFIFMHSLCFQKMSFHTCNRSLSNSDFIFSQLL